MRLSFLCEAVWVSDALRDAAGPISAAVRRHLGDPHAEAEAFHLAALDDAMDAEAGAEALDELMAGIEIPLA